jgi:hypothetical protein
VRDVGGGVAGVAQHNEIGLYDLAYSWCGASGRRYRFSVYPLDAEFLALDGVYVLARPGDRQIAYQPLVIGHCADFAHELPGSATLAAARAAGATTLHLYYSNRTNPDRRAMTRDLVECHWPPLNARPRRYSAAPGAVAAAPAMGVVIPFPRARKLSA